MTILPELLPAAIFFLYVSYETASLIASKRAERFSTGLDLLLMIIPAIAPLVFCVLFLFVLKDRFYERLSHAVLLLALWLFAARYFWVLGSFFKQLKKMTELSAVVFALLCTIFEIFRLTPLDRYAERIHSALGWASLLAGLGMLGLFYGAAYFRTRTQIRMKKAGKRNEEELNS